MKLEEITKGDVLVSTDKHGTSYYKVLKVNRSTIAVETERGDTIKAYPHLFDRKVTDSPFHSTWKT